MEGDGSSLGSCPLTGFGISGVEPSGCATKMFAFNYVTLHIMNTFRHSLRGLHRRHTYNCQCTNIIR
jgi:hypothetical protein